MCSYHLLKELNQLRTQGHLVRSWSKMAVKQMALRSWLFSIFRRDRVQLSYVISSNPNPNTNPNSNPNHNRGKKEEEKKHQVKKRLFSDFDFFSILKIHDQGPGGGWAISASDWSKLCILADFTS